MKLKIGDKVLFKSYRYDENKINICLGRINGWLGSRDYQIYYINQIDDNPYRLSFVYRDMDEVIPVPDDASEIKIEFLKLLFK